MQNALDRIIKISIYGLTFLTPLLFLPFSFEAFEYNKQYLLFFLVSLAYLSWLAKQVFYDKEIRFRKSAIDYLVLGFLAISLISAVFSVDKNSSVFGTYGRSSNGLVGLLSLGLLYFLIINNVGSKEQRKIEISKLLNLLLCSTGIAVFTSYLSIFGIWQKIGGFLPRVMLQQTFNPVSGSLEGLAVFLSAVTVLLAGLLLANSKNIFYWVLLLASLGLLSIINFTAAWLVLLVSLVLSVAAGLVKRIFKENVNKLLIPISLIIIVIAFMVLQPFKMNLFREQVLDRAVSWEVALKSSTDGIKNGLLGTGIGTFQYDFSKYKPQSFNETWMWQIRFDRAGSHFAELLATQGFPGLLVYVFLAGLFLIISWFLMSKQSVGFPLTMVFIALLTVQVFYYQNTVLSFFFWLVLGLSVASWQAVSAVPVQEKSFSFKNFPELALLFLTLTVVAGVAVLSLYFYGFKYYLADVRYAKALSVLGEDRISGLEKAVNLNPGLTFYRQSLAGSYLADALNGMQKPQSEQDTARIQLQVSKAIDQSRLVTVLSPGQVSGWEILGVVYREIRPVATGAAEWGIKSFEQAIELEPTNPVLYTELGKLYLAQGDKEKAKDNFNAAIGQKSDYSTALIQLALLLEQENIVDEAIVKLENLLKNNPYDTEARFQLGRLYFNNNRTQDAVDQFKIVTVLVPNHSNAHYSLGVAYAAQKEKELAIQEFERVLELNPGNQDVMQKLETLKGE